MNRAFYLKLAIDNLKKNSKLYLPFIFISSLTVMMYYMVTSLSLNPHIVEMIGGAVIQEMLAFGSGVISIFAVIFLFYTNSFLVKRRKKEFGLLNILGMEKKHISRVIGYESLILFLISLIFGLGFGILLDKVFYLLITKMLDAKIAFGFYISFQALLKAVVLFFLIYVLMTIFSLWQIHLSNPIELLHSDKKGEKEPKSNWFLGILGLVCMVSGYGIALRVTDPITAFALFFFAVVLVIIGTYCIFTAGSVLFLKLLRKNKAYYYKPNHFISVSNMIYRMKQNGVGLANICILSTMVLVMLSTTISLWMGMEDMINNRYPYDLNFTLRTTDPMIFEKSVEELDTAKEAADVQSIDGLVYRTLNVFAVQKGNQAILVQDGLSPADIQNVGIIYFVCAQDYNRNHDAKLVLEPDEVVIYNLNETYDHSTFKIGNLEFKVKSYLKDMKYDSAYTANVAKGKIVIVDSLDTLNEINLYQRSIYKDHSSLLEMTYSFDRSEKEARTDDEIIEDMYQFLPEYTSDHYLLVDSKEANFKEIVSLYAGFLFIGIFLSILFVMATVLIMYYKQITEGYEDQKRFEIMQNVGLDLVQVKKTINSQVLTVFFMPLIVAGIHVCVAFPMIDKMLRLLYLDNTKLFILTTGICFGVFALVYSLIYFLTSKTYYGIVRRSK